MVRQESVGRLEEFRASHTLQDVNVSFFVVNVSRSTKAILTNLRNDSLLVLPRFALESCIKVAITVRGDCVEIDTCCRQ